MKNLQSAIFRIAHGRSKINNFENPSSLKNNHSNSLLHYKEIYQSRSKTYSSKYIYICFLAFGLSGFMIYKCALVPNQKLRDLMVEGNNIIKAVRDKDVIFVLGNPGSGKSTTIAYLMGANVKPRQINEKLVYVIDEDPSSYPQINHAVASQITHAQILSSGNFTFCVLPLFVHNLSSQEQILKTMMRELAIKSAKSRKIIIVIGYDEITLNRGKEFEKFSRQLSDLFVNPEEMARSVLWCITKVPSNQQSQSFSNELENYHKNKIISPYQMNQKAIRSKLPKIQKSINKQKQTLKNIGIEVMGHQQDLYNRNKLKRMKAHIQMIKQIKMNNLILLDLKTPISKQKILKKIQQMDSIDSNKFVFDEYDPFHIIFRKEFMEIVDNGIKNQNKKEIMTREIANASQKIIQLRQSLDLSKESVMNDNLKARLLINTYKNEKMHNFQNLKSIKGHLSELQNVLKDIDTKQLIILYQKYQSEKRAFLSPNWSQFQFRYQGQPWIHKKQETDTHGKMKYTKEDRASGIYEGIYVGGLGMDSKASVTLYTEKRLESGNVRLISQIKQQMQKYQHKIKQITSKNKQLDYLIQINQKKSISIQRFVLDNTQYFLKQKNNLTTQLQVNKIQLEQINKAINDNYPNYAFANDLLDFVSFGKQPLMIKFRQIFPKLLPNIPNLAFQPLQLSSSEKYNLNKKRIYINSATYGGFGLLGIKSEFKFQTLSNNDKMGSLKFNQVMRSFHLKKDFAKIQVNKDILGNPCRGGKKQLQIMYQCYRIGQFGKRIFDQKIHQSKGFDGENIVLDCRSEDNVQA